MSIMKTIIDYIKENNLRGNKKGSIHKTKYQKRKSHIARLWKRALKGTTFDEK